MNESTILIIKIVSMVLVILVGWLARKLGWLDAPTTTVLSRFTTDLTLPAMIFSQIISTVRANELRQAWPIPIIGASILLLGQFIAWLCWKPFAASSQSRTFIFAVMLTNWIYLPLPIVQSLYGAEGTRVVLLCNVGVQIILWTSGVATLSRDGLRLKTLWKIATNPGIIATVAGIAVAIFIPQVSQMRLAQPMVEAITMIGSLTIPLSLIATGAQLAAVAKARPASVAALSGILLLRLIVIPLVSLGLLFALQRSPAHLPPITAMCALLISAMPVAISASILAERYGQDTDLAAQSIFYSTIASIVTVPAIFVLAGRVL